MFNNKKNPLSNLLGGKKDNTPSANDTQGEKKGMLGLGALQNNTSGGASLFASEVAIPTGHVDFGLNLNTPPQNAHPSPSPTTEAPSEFAMPDNASFQDILPANDSFSNDPFTQEPDTDFDPNQFDLPADTASATPDFQQHDAPMPHTQPQVETPQTQSQSPYEVADDFEPNAFDNVAPPAFKEASPNTSTPDLDFEFEESIGDFNTTDTAPSQTDSFDHFIQQPHPEFSAPDLNTPNESVSSAPADASQVVPAWQTDLDSQGFIDGDMPDDFIKDVPNAAQIEAELEASMRDDVDDFHSPDLDAAFASTGNTSTNDDDDDLLTYTNDDHEFSASTTLDQLEPSPETYTELLNDGNTPSTPTPTDISQQNQGFNQTDFLKSADDQTQPEFRHIDTTPDDFKPVAPPTYSTSPESVNLDHELATQAGEFLDNVDAFYPEEPLDITQSETNQISMGSKQSPLNVEQTDLIHTADAFEEASKYLMPETATNPVGFDDIPAQNLPDLPPPPPSSLSHQLPTEQVDDSFASTTETSTPTSNDMFEATSPQDDNTFEDATTPPASFLSSDDAVSTDDVLYDNPLGFDEALSFSSPNDDANSITSDAPYQVNNEPAVTESTTTQPTEQKPDFVDPTDPNALAGWDESLNGDLDDPMSSTMMDDFLPSDEHDIFADPFAQPEPIQETSFENPPNEAPSISLTPIPLPETTGDDNNNDDAFAVTGSKTTPESPASVAMSEKPANTNTGVNMETLEVLDSIHLSNNKKLLLVRNELPGTSPAQAVYALMGQEGNPENPAEELAISVVKILEPHHLGLVAGQHHSDVGSPKITAVKEGKAGDKDMFITKVGQWQGIISADEGSIILHTEI